MLSSLTIAQLLAALFCYGVFSIFCPCVSLLYCLEAAAGVPWTQLLYWIAGSLACVLLSFGFRFALRSLNSRDNEKHLLFKVRSNWILLIVSLILAGIALLWNGRYLLPLWSSGPTGIASGICLILSLVLAFLKKPRIDLSYSDLSSIALACAIVLGFSPASLSPLLCFYTCLFAFSLNGLKELIASHLVLPLILFALSRFIRDDSLNLTMLLSALVIVALVLYLLKQKQEIKEYRNRLRYRENEMDMDRRRMDELEMGIVKNERENLLNMLELRRKDVTQAAEKLTSQRMFMQDIYNLLVQAESASAIEGKDILLHEMKSKINLRMNFSDERNDFDTQVEELHKDFSIRLENRFPQLTAQEKKLATMLRLDFPTKYIAAILNISPKSVEIERHRLRKKFGLDRKTKLTDFVKTI